MPPRKTRRPPPGIYICDALADFWIVVDKARCPWLIDTRRDAWRSRKAYDGHVKDLIRADTGIAPLVAKVAGIPPEELGLNA